MECTDREKALFPRALYLCRNPQGARLSQCFASRSEVTDGSKIRPSEGGSAAPMRTLRVGAWLAGGEVAAVAAVSQCRRAIGFPPDKGALPDTHKGAAQ